MYKFKAGIRNRKNLFYPGSLLVQDNLTVQGAEYTKSVFFDEVGPSSIPGRVKIKISENWSLLT